MNDHELRALNLAKSKRHEGALGLAPGLFLGLWSIEILALAYGVRGDTLLLLPQADVAIYLELEHR